MGHPFAHGDTWPRRTRLNRDGGGMRNFREFQTEPDRFAGECVDDGFVRTKRLDFPASPRVSDERALLRFMAAAWVDTGPDHHLLFDWRDRWPLGSVDGNSGRLSRGRDQWRRRRLRLHQASASRLRPNLKVLAMPPDRLNPSGFRCSRPTKYGVTAERPFAKLMLRAVTLRQNRPPRLHHALTGDL